MNTATDLVEITVLRTLILPGESFVWLTAVLASSGRDGLNNSRRLWFSFFLFAGYHSSEDNECRRVNYGGGLVRGDVRNPNAMVRLSVREKRLYEHSSASDLVYVDDVGK